MAPKPNSSAPPSGQQQTVPAPLPGQQQSGSNGPAPSNRALKRAKRSEEDRGKQAALWGQETGQASKPESETALEKAVTEPAKTSTATNTVNPTPAVASKVDPLENNEQLAEPQYDSDLVFSDPEDLNEDTQGGVQLDVGEDGDEDMQGNTDTVLESVTRALQDGETSHLLRR